MPAYGTIDIPSLSEISAVKPDVWIGGTLFDYCWCDAIERNVNAIPSKAILRLGGSGYDVQGNVTLNAFDFSDMVPWTRVAIASGIEPYFLGALKKRRDQGQANSIVWEAWDDRWLLTSIPVRGCLVYDALSDQVIFVSGFVNRVNPCGYHNCRGAKIPGIDGIVPVFTWTAEAGAAYENSDTVDSVLADGVVGAWTPYKYIKYQCALANIKAGSIPGTDPQTWRSLSTSTRLGWDMKSCELLTTDSQDTKDMYKKMPDHTFQGKNMLGTLGEVLRIAPSFGMKLGAAKDSNGNLKSALTFYSRDLSYAEKVIDIPLLRGGPANDIRTVWDFDVDDDSSEVSESVLVEGSRRKVEFSIETGWDGTQGVNRSLAFSWSTDEATALAFCINGGNKPGDSQYAKFPRRIPDLSKGELWMNMGFDAADGNNGRPLALANTQDALQLARSFLPRPYAACEIDSQYAAVTDTNKPLLGFNQKFADSKKYPVLFNPRPIMPEQLQYYLDRSDRKMRARFPVRIRLYDGTQWHDVLTNSGLRVEGDGTIFFDGLTDDNMSGSNAKYSLYSGSLLSDPGNVKIKQIAINAAVPLDHRVSGYATLARNQIDPAMAKEMGGPLLHYIDAPEGFKENHQVNSQPCAATSMAGATAGGVATIPINQILEDDSARAANHALRAVKAKSFTKRISSLAMIGIQNQYDVGMFIGQIVVSGQAGDENYRIDAPIERLLLDFKDQLTRIGGLLSESGKGQQSKRAFTVGAAPIASKAAGMGKTDLMKMDMFGFGAQQKMMAGGAAGIAHTFSQTFAAQQKMFEDNRSTQTGSRQNTDNPMYAALAAAVGASKKMRPGDWAGRTNNM